MVILPQMLDFKIIKKLPSLSSFFLKVQVCSWAFFFVFLKNQTGFNMAHACNHVEFVFVCQFMNRTHNWKHVDVFEYWVNWNNKLLLLKPLKLWVFPCLIHCDLMTSSYLISSHFVCNTEKLETVLHLNEEVLL